MSEPAPVHTHHTHTITQTHHMHQVCTITDTTHTHTPHACNHTDTPHTHEYNQIHHMHTITDTPQTPHAHNRRYTTHTMWAQPDTPHAQSQTHHTHTVRHTTHTPCAHTCMHMYHTAYLTHTYLTNQHTTHTHTWMGTLFEVKSWNGQRKTGCAVGGGRPSLGTRPGVLYRDRCVTGKRLSQPPAPEAVRKGQRRRHTLHGEPAQSQPPSLSGKKGILEGVAQHWPQDLRSGGSAARHKAAWWMDKDMPQMGMWRGSPSLPCAAGLWHWLRPPVVVQFLSHV